MPCSPHLATNCLQRRLAGCNRLEDRREVVHGAAVDLEERRSGAHQGKYYLLERWRCDALDGRWLGGGSPSNELAATYSYYMYCILVVVGLIVGTFLKFK